MLRIIQRIALSEKKKYETLRSEKETESIARRA